jgi:BirA family transcriptional regulator, biotin operon repressor / biotin---[acetyl-CoA-carboxylase] ligase
MISHYTIRHFESIGSTNDELRQLAAEGAASGTVIHADEQIAGRGRMARKWFSPPGNLYLSILVRTGLPPARSSELAFVTSVAVAETVRSLVPPRVSVRLKWPNDVLVNDAKISGVLLEQADDAVIVGIGLNILLAPTVEGYLTTTIAAQGGIATVDGTRDILLDRFRRFTGLWATEGFAPIRAAWLDLAHRKGSDLKVTHPSGPIIGRFAGLDMDGALLLDTQDGQIRILAGDVAV